MDAVAPLNGRSGDYVDSYYAASANPAPLRPRLYGEESADICVIGGGYSGLSASITLLEKGYQVTLVEAERIGWGASGRNGGQIVNGLNASLDKFERQYGKDVAAFVGSIVQEGAQLIRERIAKYRIACDLKDKNLFTAFTPKQMKELEDKQVLWRRFGMDDHELLDRDGVRRHVNTDAYFGGMIDHSGGHMHPLNLALGEADAVEKLGGRIFEKSRVVSVDYAGETPVVRTGEGVIRARHLVICGNAYLGHAVPALTPRILPVSTQIMATAPLSPELAQELLPTDICVEDCRYILDYYRLSGDKRLLFGGGTVYGGKDAKDVIAKLMPNMIRIFPQLEGIKIDYAWNGNFALSFSRIPQMGKLAKHTWFAHGYSGHGVTGSHLFGKILGDAIDGDLARFDVFAKLRWLPFPGGRTFGAQYSALGSWYYSLRDRLGI
jgi:gamma-glutamylputrescine oxidase